MAEEEYTEYQEPEDTLGYGEPAFYKFSEKPCRQFVNSKKSTKKTKKKRKKAMNFIKGIATGLILAKKEHDDAVLYMKQAQDADKRKEQEEEELQLALALSRSAQEGTTTTTRTTTTTTSNHPRPRGRGSVDEEFTFLYSTPEEEERERLRKLAEQEEEDLRLALQLHEDSVDVTSPSLHHPSIVPTAPPIAPTENDEDELARAMAESLREAEAQKAAEKKPSLRDSDLARMIQEEEIKSARALVGAVGPVEDVLVKEDIPSPVAQSTRTHPLRDSGLAQQLADEELARHLLEQENSQPTSLLDSTDLQNMTEEEMQERVRAEMLKEQKEMFLQRLEEEKRLAEQREQNRVESLERERIIKEQNAAYEESLREDMMKEHQKLEEEKKAQEEKANQEAEAELQSAKELSIKLSREAELQMKKEKWEATPKPTEKDTNGICTLVVRLPSGERIQNKFFASDKLETVRDLLDVKLLEGDVAYPFKYNIVNSYPYTQFPDNQQTLAEAGLCPRALVNVELVENTED